MPAVKKMKRERAETLNLFLVIPKGAIQSICNSLTPEKDELKVKKSGKILFILFQGIR